MTARGSRRVRLPTLGTVAREWDALAERRDEQVRSGRDLSFSRVLTPVLLRLCTTCDWTSVVDAGCGTGVLTERLARRARRVVGIDLSRKSIELARAHSALPYEVSSIEAFSRSHPGSFTLAVSNMVLTAAPRLRGILKALAALLRTGGHLVFSIPHPWFWPTYWGYADAPWFSYHRTIAIEAPFRISLDREIAIRSTHIHRPLETYASALGSAGFTIQAIVEPIPEATVQRKYPRTWTSPRFLLARCRKER